MESLEEQKQEASQENVTVVGSQAEAEALAAQELDDDSPGEVVKIKSKDEVKPSTIKKTGKKHAYKFIRNTKYKGVRYSIGDAVEASGEDLEMLLSNGLIQ